jgi:putative addiction module component (TIGR02574 family)
LSGCRLPKRIALIAQLWDSLDDDQLPLSGAQQAELESRLTSLDQDRRDGVTWAALKAELEETRRRTPQACLDGSRIAL